MSVLEIPAYSYHADLIDEGRPSLSRSVIQTMVQKSPAHAKAVHPKLNPLWQREDKTAFDVGTVCHELLLDGAAGVQVISYDSWRTNAAKEARDRARQHGLVPLLQHEWEQVDAMMTAVREQLAVRDDDPPLFTNGDPELTLTWEEAGVLCRARLDWLAHDHATVDDFKTSSNAEPFKFSRGSFYDHGYDLQAAWYQRAVRACFGVDPVFRLAVVEKQPPFQVIVFDAAPDVLALANTKIDWALGTWKQCLETGEWPGYPTRTHSVTLPPWAEDQWWARFEGTAA